MTIDELVEEYRIRLDLEPWEDHEKKMKVFWETSQALSKEGKEEYKRRRRQYGTTVRAMLRAIAEAALHKRPILVNGPRDKARLYASRLQDLILKLGVDVDVEATERFVTVYTDHLFTEL